MVSMSGRFSLGHAYVAFSRCRTLEGLHILNCNVNNIKTNSKSVVAVKNHQSLLAPPKISLQHNSFLHIISLNCRSWNCHANDAMADRDIVH